MVQPKSNYDEVRLVCADPWRAELFEKIHFPYNRVLRISSLGLDFGDIDSLCRHLRGLPIDRRSVTIFAHSHEECAIGSNAREIGIDLAKEVGGALRLPTAATHLHEKEGPEVSYSLFDHFALDKIMEKKAKWPKKGYSVDSSKPPETITVAGQYFLGQPRLGDVRLIAGLIHEGTVSLLRHLFPAGIPVPEFLPGVTPGQREQVLSLLTVTC